MLLEGKLPLLWGRAVAALQRAGMVLGVHQTPTAERDSNCSQSENWSGVVFSSVHNLPCLAENESNSVHTLQFMFLSLFLKLPWGHPSFLPARASLLISSFSWHFVRFLLPVYVFLWTFPHFFQTSLLLLRCQSREDAVFYNTEKLLS